MVVLFPCSNLEGIDADYSNLFLIVSGFSSFLLQINVTAVHGNAKNPFFSLEKMFLMYGVEHIQALQACMSYFTSLYVTKYKLTLSNIMYW